MPQKPVSQHLWMVNMLKGPQNSLNLHGSIFVNFFDRYEKKAAEKNMI